MFSFTYAKSILQQWSTVYAEYSILWSLWLLVMGYAIKYPYFRVRAQTELFCAKIASRRKMCAPSYIRTVTYKYLERTHTHTRIYSIHITCVHALTHTRPGLRGSSYYIKIEFTQDAYRQSSLSPESH